jgi:hypothetical protein
MPIGLAVRGGPEAFEALANDAGPPLDRKAPTTRRVVPGMGANRPTRVGQLAQVGSSNSRPYFFIFL